MPIPLTEQRTLTVAFLGNPNTGKSTLFSALAGVHQRVGNYPGVTVEKKVGRMRFAGRQFELIDLPGLYSLAPRSRDEMVAVDVLLGRSPGVDPVDVVVSIVDASNLQRNLYLASQVLEAGLPTVIVVNMLDVAEEQGVRIDLAALERELGVPVVATQAHRRMGLTDLKRALVRAAQQQPASRSSPLPQPFQAEVAALEVQFGPEGAFHSGEPVPRFLVQRLVLDSAGYLERSFTDRHGAALVESLQAIRQRLAADGCAVPDVETTARYTWASGLMRECVTQSGRRRRSATDRIDRVLTHRVVGTLIFAVLMAVVFQAVFTWAVPLMGWIEAFFGWLGGLIEGSMAPGMLRDLLIDGVIGGVGGVLTFLPQILILFFFIALMEDSGYMARAAYLMDRLMARVGLSGKSFVPMLSSFACTIPGIMAARVIENERDRLTTILVAPLLTCSARLPIYALLIAAFVPAEKYLGGYMTLQGLTLLGLYLLGGVAAVVVAMLLKRTLLRGETPPFLMELPNYKWPSLRTVVLRMAERALVFVRCAGTLILAVSILVWAAIYFPQNPAEVAPLRAERETLARQYADSPSPALAERIAEIDGRITTGQQRYSILGRMGRAIEPVVRPLGWDWRIGCAVIASFPARELVVSTMGIIFAHGEVDVESEDGSRQFEQRLRNATWEGADRPLFTLPVALSLMVFFALCAQCTATLATIRRETNSWRWPLFTFAYMTALAYAGALVAYQAGTWIIGNS